MDETRLSVGARPSNTHQNPAGLTQTTVHNGLYKFRSENESNPIHQLQEDYGVNWIVIENDLVYDSTNSYFEQIRQPNGDIHLRLVNIFTNNSKNNAGQPQPSQEADDRDYGE